MKEGNPAVAERFLPGSEAHREAVAAGKFVSIGISRLRLGSDGVGVTTLICGYGCPLRCQYCLNPQSFAPDTPLRAYSPEELISVLSPDSLYFYSTGGGVTFGGGEPLLQADFLPRFRAVADPRWKINAETSLSVPEQALLTAIPSVDHWFVDVKDGDGDRYRAYTGAEATRTLENLRLLLDAVGPERVTVRLPLIPGFNTEEGREETAALITSLGGKRLDRFTYRLPKGKKQQNPAP